MTMQCGKRVAILLYSVFLFRSNFVFVVSLFLLVRSVQRTPSYEHQIYNNIWSYYDNDMVCLNVRTYCVQNDISATSHIILYIYIQYFFTTSIAFLIIASMAHWMVLINVERFGRHYYCYSCACPSATIIDIPMIIIIIVPIDWT